MVSFLSPNACPPTCDSNGTIPTGKSYPVDETKLSSILGGLLRRRSLPGGTGVPCDIVDLAIL